VRELQGVMARQLRPGCSIPTDCGATRTLASVVRVTTHAAGSGCLNCHGRRLVPLRCAPQPAICPFCDFAPGDAPQRRLHTARAACSRGTGTCIYERVYVLCSVRNPADANCISPNLPLPSVSSLASAMSIALRCAACAEPHLARGCVRVSQAGGQLVRSASHMHWLVQGSSNNRG
jgi:hypothetical protein